MMMSDDIIIIMPLLLARQASALPLPLLLFLRHYHLRHYHAAIIDYYCAIID